MGVSYGQLAGIMLTFISTIFALVGVGYAISGVQEQYDGFCFYESSLEIMIGTGFIGIIGHLIAAAFYLRSAATAGTASPASPAMAGVVATVNPVAPPASPIPAGTKFCSSCGAALSGAAFCPGCGQKQ
jgi:hypothetical protein